MKWFWITDKYYNCKPHAVPEVLLEPIINNLESRGIVEIRSTLMGGLLFSQHKITDKSFLHTRTVDFDGIKIDIPLVEVEDISNALKNLDGRMDIGTLYYKLHGFNRCICLTPSQKTTFIKRIKVSLPKVLKVAPEKSTKLNINMAGVYKIVPGKNET